MTEDQLTTQEENYADWFNELVLKADLADYSPVRGCMVVKPYGWSLWENCQAALDQRFKATGHTNAAFPLLIPKSFLEKEKEHVEGFSPELAVVTIGGGEELEEPLVVRPTSETIIGYMYSKWVKSWRDLPVLINQWGSVVRWEMRTKLFLRTSEFYWQEGHTAHETEEEAIEETFRMLDVYEDFAVNEAAIPVIKGIKSQTEKFAGAVMSTTIEAMMGDTKSLQSGTSHFLGQNFSKAFDIQFLGRNNELQHAWTTSWGLSTRMIGAIIMTHGDNKGLRLPPRLAPIQVIIVPIYKNDEEKEAVTAVANRIFSEFKENNIRVKLDDRDGLTPGYKFNDWEMRGVPVRIEIGPKDIANGTVAAARRDVPGKEGKSFISQEDLSAKINDLLIEIQASMLKRATEFRDSHIFDPQSLKDLVEIVKNGWALSYWCESAACESKVKELSKATTRCIPLGQEDHPGNCIVCGAAAKRKVIFGRAY